MTTELLAQPADVLNAWPAYGLLSAYEQIALLGTASAKVMKFCRRVHFLPWTNLDPYDGKGLPRIWLEKRPVLTVTAITMNGDAVDNTSGFAWGFKPRTGELWLGSGRDDKRFGQRFPHGRQNILVAFTSGYTTVPEPVVRATIWAVKWLSEQIAVSGIYSAERIGDYNYSLNAAAFSMTLPMHIAALLADYVQDDGPL